MGLVDFFIAGVQKGGTTALDAFLRRHPEVQMASIKEVHHFDNDAMDWSSPSHQKLASQFDWGRKGVIRGEATPIYIYWPSALARLKDYNRSAKIIIGLRHPSFRAYSHWKMETSRGEEPLSFEQAISGSGRQRVLSSGGGVHRVYSYVERGFYADQITAALQVFTREQLYFYRTDQLWLNPTGVLSEIENFLGIARHLNVPAGEYIVPAKSLSFGQISSAARKTLDSVFCEQIAMAAGLTGLDLEDWLQASYSEPMPLRNEV